MIYHEDVEKLSDRMCHQCHKSGWSSRLLSQECFHFVIASPDKWGRPTDLDILESKSHVLHGIIHSNGNGHLLSMKSGDDGVGISELKKLWERICRSVHARSLLAISSEDYYGDMFEFRLLCAIAYGPDWADPMGYKVHIQKESLKAQYDKSVDCLQKIKLDSPHMIKYNHIASTYNVTGQTLGDLFCKLMDARRNETNITFLTFADVIKIIKNQNPTKYISLSLKVVDHMKKGKTEGEDPSFTARELHEVFPGSMLNEVLAHIHNTTVGNSLVRRLRVRSAYSYYIEDPANVQLGPNQVMEDLKEVYNHISSLDQCKEDLRTILQHKILVRTYKHEDYNVGDAFNYICEYEADNVEEFFWFSFG
ncbi:hypothetical protein LXL04_013145 [Taraxacum kok-saghyz]